MQVLAEEQGERAAAAAERRASGVPSDQSRSDAPKRLHGEMAAASLGSWLEARHIKTSAALMEKLDELGVEDKADLEALEGEDVEAICTVVKKIEQNKLREALAEVLSQASD